ncbi:hypothetical protein [Amycolatopsis sp. NPDC059021]
MPRLDRHADQPCAAATSSGVVNDAFGTLSVLYASFGTCARREPA